MTDINQIYVCERCGIIVRQVTDTGETPVHCDKPMKESDVKQQAFWQYKPFLPCPQ